MRRGRRWVYGVWVNEKRTAGMISVKGKENPSRKKKMQEIKRLNKKGKKTSFMKKEGS